MIVSRFLPLIAAAILLVGSGVYLLEKAERQAHDTTRKHHLQDIEQSLFFARDVTGTYPPYEEPTWCGFLNDPKNRTARAQVEAVLREQNDKYANSEKPFPTDPLYAREQHDSSSETWDYFYWKRSPSTFELYAVLEEEKTGERNSLNCENAEAHYFDYGLASVHRERSSRIISSPL